jgi:hypothetical protein
MSTNVQIVAVSLVASPESQDPAVGGLVWGLHIALMPVHRLVSLGWQAPMTHKTLSGKRSRNLLQWETNSMKTTIFVLCFFCATAAFAQNANYGAVSAEPVVIQFTSHTGHASPQPMGTEQNLLGQSGFTYAHGERPLWEVASPSQVTPLGDSARVLKKAHETAKKADIVWNN